MRNETVGTNQHRGASRSTTGQRGRALAAAGVLVALGSFIAPTSVVDAVAGDYSLDFTAAAPLTYDHFIGGGAYNDRTIGIDKDVVESLEGADFACGDHVSFLTRITRNLGNTQSPTEVIELKYSFLADTTGQSGIALAQVMEVEVQYATEPGTTNGVGGADEGTVDFDGDSNATLVGPPGGVLTKPIFTKGAKLEAIIQVSDLEHGESVVLRIDVLLACKAGARPTGNLQADLVSAKVVGLSGRAGTISVGKQTIPFRNVQDVYPLPPARYANLESLSPASRTAEVASLAPASVARSASSLPETGSSGTLDLVQLGALLATAGAVGLVASRRRSLAAQSRQR